MRLVYISPPAANVKAVIEANSHNRSLVTHAGATAGAEDSTVYLSLIVACRVRPPNLKREPGCAFFFVARRGSQAKPTRLAGEN
jgi:hypothetical protein